MATIKDVARVAGVSIATVSAYLNDSARVSEKLVRRVREAIESTGYSPDGIARSLRRGRSRSIGLVVGDISNPFFTSLAKAIEARASEAGYLVILANSDESPERELKLLQLLREQRVAGILLAPSGYDASYISAIARIRDLPLVLVDRRLSGASLDSVVVDNVAAARMVTDYLLRLGHRRIAMVVGREHLSTTEQRLCGFRDGLRAAGIDPDPTLERIADSRTETAYQVVQRLLTSEARPTAIFAANNLMMLGAIEAVLDMGFQCPDQISLAGIDDFPWSSAIRPRLTTVAQPIEELGARAVDNLLDRISCNSQHDATERPRVVTLEPRLLIRDSCKSLISSPNPEPQSRRRHNRGSSVLPGLARRKSSQ